MERIARLPETVINQIAAGEVVERPASVVKELLENAIDAEATRVTVEITNGGLDRIRIVDDGIGMSSADAQLALERHATSKLRVLEDLDTLGTLGFRGEAIPSIASVSRFSITTCERGAMEGTLVVVNGGTVERVEAAGAPAGTTIDVRDLFYNVPARRKFMKRAETESSHVHDVVVRLAIARPHVAIKLVHNGRVVLDVPAATEVDPRGRLGRIFGREVSAHLHPLLEQEAEIEVRGWCAAPELSERTTRGLYTFVNGRFVRDRTIQHAVQEGYRTLLERGRYPVVVVSVELDPSLLDVNVHPQKTEVRFAAPNDVHRAIAATLTRTLAEEPWLGPRGASDAQSVLRAARSGVGAGAGSGFGAEGAGSGFGGGSGGAAGFGAAGSGSSAEEGSWPPGSSGRPRAPGSWPPGSGQGRPPGSWPPSSGEGRASDGRAVDPGALDAALDGWGGERPAREEGVGRFDGSGRLLGGRDRLDGDGEERRPSADPFARSGEPFALGVGERSTAPRGYGTADRGRRSEGRSEPRGQGPLFPRSAWPQPPPWTAWSDGAAGTGTPARAPRFSALEPVGQVMTMYLVCQGEGRLVLIDQHAAHERIAFERMRKQRAAGAVHAQPLLVPQMIALDAARAATADDRREELGTLGFELEPFGGETWALKTVPVALGNVDVAQVLLDVLDELRELDGGRAPLDDAIGAALSCAACHTVVRAGDRLGKEEIKALLVQMDEIDFGAHCPHGRPVFVEWTDKQLATLFHRT